LNRKEDFIMGKFGWDLPPGCHTLPGEEPEGPCEVCGKDIDSCICHECPECGASGDPLCYEKHGMVKTRAQIDSLYRAEKKWEADAKADQEYWEQIYEELGE